MKADVRPAREMEALEWAIQYFRETTAKNTEEKLQYVQRCAQWHFERGDEQQLDHTVRWALFTGNELNFEVLSRLALKYIESDKPLPLCLKHFVMSRLLYPNWKPRIVNGKVEFERFKRKRGKSRHDNYLRDVAILVAVGIIAERWGLHPRRGADKRGSATGPSAAWIVSEALRLGPKIHLSESGVTKILDKAPSFRR
jgi:hypothetical protein